MNRINPIVAGILSLGVIGLVVFCAGSFMIYGLLAVSEQDPDDFGAVSIASLPPDPTSTMLDIPTTIALTSEPAYNTTSCVPRSDWIDYRVVSGDTLSSIAERVGLPTGELVTANCLDNADRIQVGQVLVIPSSIIPTSNRSGQAGTIIQDGTNIRTGPGEDYMAIDYLNRNTPISAFSRSEDGLWIVVNGAGLEGWASADAVQTHHDALPILPGPYPPPYSPAPSIEICNVLTRNPQTEVFVHPDANSAIMIQLASDTELIANAQRNGFYQVVFPDGSRTGWIARGVLLVLNQSTNCNFLPVTELPSNGTCLAVNISSDTIGVYATQDTSQNFIIRMPVGIAFEVVQQSDAMTEVSFTSDQTGLNSGTGWIESNAIRLEGPC